MSTIEIRHPHSLAPAQARKAVEDFAVKLGERFGLDYRWEGDVMHFKRTGVDGQIALQPGRLPAAPHRCAQWHARPSPVGDRRHRSRETAT